MIYILYVYAQFRNVCCIVFYYFMPFSLIGPYVKSSWSLSLLIKLVFTYLPIPRVNPLYIYNGRIAYNCEKSVLLYIVVNKVIEMLPCCVILMKLDVD